VAGLFTISKGGSMNIPGTTAPLGAQGTQHPSEINGFKLDPKGNYATKKVDDGKGNYFTLTVATVGLSPDARDAKLATFDKEVCRKYAEIAALMKVGVPKAKKEGKTLRQVQFKHDEASDVTSVTKTYTNAEPKTIENIVDDKQKKLQSAQIASQQPNADMNKLKDKIKNISVKIKLFEALGQEITKAKGSLAPKPGDVTLTPLSPQEAAKEAHRKKLESLIAEDEKWFKDLKEKSAQLKELKAQLVLTTPQASTDPNKPNDPNDPNKPNELQMLTSKIKALEKELTPMEDTKVSRSTLASERITELKKLNATQ
jgi:hypothetical protein